MDKSDDWIWTPKWVDWIDLLLFYSSSPNRLDDSGGCGVSGAFHVSGEVVFSITLCFLISRLFFFIFCFYLC